MIQLMKNFRCGLPLLAFSSASFLGLGGFAGFYLKDYLSMISKPQSPTALVAREADQDKMPEKAKGAVSALKQFLGATTVNERLRHVMGADVIKPQMERYYQQASDGPVMIDRIEFVRMDPNPTMGNGSHCILSLESKAWEFEVPVMLEEEPDGFKVDWVAFVEFKDRLLEKFFKTYQKEPMRFHVGIQRAHYFGDEVADVSRKDCFHVSPAPPNSFQGHVFLEKGTELAEELRTDMPWETHLWAVVELEWKKVGAQQWVEVKEVPQMHWYSEAGYMRAGSLEK